MTQKSWLFFSRRWILQPFGVRSSGSSHFFLKAQSLMVASHCRLWSKLGGVSTISKHHGYLNFQISSASFGTLSSMRASKGSLSVSLRAYAISDFFGRGHYFPKS